MYTKAEKIAMLEKAIELLQDANEEACNVLGYNDPSANSMLNSIHLLTCEIEEIEASDD